MEVTIGVAGPPSPWAPFNPSSTPPQQSNNPTPDGGGERAGQGQG